MAKDLSAPLYLSTGLGREATYLPAGLPSINPHHRRDAYQQHVQEGVRLPCDQMFGAPPRQGSVDDRQICQTVTRFPPLRPPAPESGQRSDEGTLRPAGHLDSFSNTRQSASVLPYAEVRKIIQTSDILGRPLHHHHNHHPAERPQTGNSGISRKDVSRSRGQTATIPGGYSVRVALRRSSVRVGKSA